MLPTPEQLFRLQILAAAAAGILLAISLMTGLAKGQEMHHGHPKEDQEIHEKFYKTWDMPKHGEPRTVSCCNDEDCFPTEVKQENGIYYAQSHDKLRWVRIPDEKIEQNQTDPVESPDGRSHVCMNPYDIVYCFTLGSGI